MLDFPDPGDNVHAHVNHEKFWDTDVDLGSYFYWEAWLAPRTDGYLISDGYGSYHALLWGPLLISPSAMIFQGQTWNGSIQIAFSTNEGPTPGEWGHHAVALAPDPQHGNALTLYVFWNGICLAMNRFGAGTRHTLASNYGAGVLYVMGSTHQTLGGRLAAIRGWDRTWPNRPANPAWAFSPDRVFDPALAGTPPDFLAEYTRPALAIPDLSPTGYNGGGSAVPRKHPGRLENSVVPQVGPLPRWVEDSDCPYGPIGGTPVSHTMPPPRPSPIDDTLIFDSFTRANQNFVFQSVPSLGKTESGSLGPLSWTTATLGAPIAPAPFGLINGRAVFLERQAGVAWVDAGTIDQDVRVERVHLLTESGGTSGLAFRVQDGQTWSYLFVDEEQGSPGIPAPLVLGSFVAGVPGPVTKITAPDENWNFMRVVAKGSTITVFVGMYGMDGWNIALATVENRPSVSAAATGVGLAGATTPTQASSIWRADSFTVCVPDKCR